MDSDSGSFDCCLDFDAAGRPDTGARSRESRTLPRDPPEDKLPCRNAALPVVAAAAFYTSHCKIPPEPRLDSTPTRTFLLYVSLAFALSPLSASAAPKDVPLALDDSSSMKVFQPDAPVGAETGSAEAVVPQAVALPELKLPEAAPLLLGSPWPPAPPQQDASDGTAALPAQPKAGIAFETFSDPTPEPRLGAAGALGPEEAAHAGPPEEEARPKTTPPAAARDGGRGSTFPGSVWIAALLIALAGAALTVRSGLRRRRATGNEPVPEDQLPKAFLNDLGGISEKPSYELGDSLTVIGRIRGGNADGINYVVIPEPTVGRRHALIEFRNHCFWVTDQDSLNGTFINDKRIEGDARLKHGDRVRFHRHEFEFLLLDLFESDRTRTSQTGYAEFPRAADGDRRLQPPVPKDAGKAAFR